MSEYFLINIGIIAIPLVFSFESKIQFYKKIPNLLIAIFFVGIFFIYWDSIATKQGDWHFNEKYTWSFLIFNLPLEEILFFITVPYAVIFIYETIKYYIPEKELSIDKTYFYILFIILVLVSIPFQNQNYTFVVLLFCGMIFFIAALFFKNTLRSKIFWITIAITYIPFFIINYILTSIPIVTYNPESIWGIKLLTIPLEDFFYSFAMISSWLLVYNMSRNIFNSQ